LAHFSTANPSPFAGLSQGEMPLVHAAEKQYGGKAEKQCLEKCSLRVEQRRSFRCGVDNRPARLVLGELRMPVVVLDVSAGGFGVLAQAPIAVEVGQQGVMETDDGHFRVRVVHVAPEENDPMTGRPQGETGNHAGIETAGKVVNPVQPAPLWLRLGLERLGDVFLPETLSHLSNWNLRICLAKLCPSSGSIIILGLLVVMVTVGGLAAVYALRGSPALRTILQWAGQTMGLPEKSAKTPARPTKPAPLATPVPQRAKPPKTPAATPPSTRAGSASRAALPGAVMAKTEELRELRRRLPGAAIFAHPQVIRTLAITEDQQRQIQRIIELTTEAILRLDSLAGEQGLGQVAEQQRILEAARREAINLLTDQQRQQWEQWQAPPADEKP
jgi:hypothetical protein